MVIKTHTGKCSTLAFSLVTAVTADFASRSWFCLKLLNLPYIIDIIQMTKSYCFYLVFRFSSRSDLALGETWESWRERRLMRDWFYGELGTTSVKGYYGKFMVLLYPLPCLQPDEAVPAPGGNTGAYQESRYILTRCAIVLPAKLELAFPSEMDKALRPTDSRLPLKLLEKRKKKRCLNDCIGNRQSLPKGSGDLGDCKHDLWSQMPGFHMCFSVTKALPQFSR